MYFNVTLCDNTWIETNFYQKHSDNVKAID